VPVVVYDPEAILDDPEVAELLVQGEPARC
jgi:hypothetical protein